MHEFNLIHQYFTWDNQPDDILIAVGDDAAVLDLPKDKQLVTSIDTLISGVHFPKSTAPRAVGHKALAVNLSDLAAMGAEPKWFTLALTLPTIDTVWLEEFSAGLKSLAQQHQCFLIGGDTTRGPLSISIQVMGFVDQGRALLRSGAKLGDKIYVSGTLGDAAAGLQNILGELSLSEDDAVFCQKKLNIPTPRIRESKKLKTFASACIDISDGLLQDLSHILRASKMGANLDLSALPFSPVLKKLDKKQAQQLAFSGDDYELLFTVPEDKEALLLETMDSKVSCIGHITNECGKIIDESGKELNATGYNHFNDN
ncbi:MAG: thiamine-phosphate kinase [Cocleimonas sp.]